MKTMILAGFMMVAAATTTAQAASLCRNCSLTVTFLDATGSGAGRDARDAAAAFTAAVPALNVMPLQVREVQGDGPGVKLEVGTYEEYAATNQLDGIDVAQVARGVARASLVGTSGFLLQIEVSGTR